MFNMKNNVHLLCCFISLCLFHLPGVFMIRRLTLASLLIASFALPSAVLAQAPGWANIRVGVEANYPPF